MSQQKKFLSPKREEGYAPAKQSKKYKPFTNHMKRVNTHTHTHTHIYREQKIENCSIAPKYARHPKDCKLFNSPKIGKAPKK